MKQDKENLKTDENLFIHSSREGLKDLVEVIEEEYKQGKNFSKNGGYFTIAEDFFRRKIGKVWDYYKVTGRKECLELISTTMNLYNGIVNKYQ